MADEQQHNEDSQKTLVAFVVGLLIGGMLVWAFSGPSDKKDATDKTEAEKTETVDASKDEMKNEDGTPKLSVGDGNIVVKDQAASKSIVMENATYPVAEGWVGVREYTDDKLGYILGVNRFSESQGLVPENIELVTSTIPGKKYAIVVYKEDGDFDFNLAGDVQIDEIFSTFTAE